MFLQNRNFGDAIAVQNVREFIYEILFDVPPRTKILAPPLLSPPNIRVQETPWLPVKFNGVECRV